MLLKTSTITLCCSPVHSCSSPTQHLPSWTSSLRPSPSQPCPHQRRQQQHSQKQCRRRYATHNDAGDKSGSGSKPNHPVPDWPRNPNPTPYEIFDINHKAPYTKHRFYQLVKLYHPDKHHPSSSQSPSTTATSSSPNITHSTRLERYRLIIAANDILSSPSKRALYDTHGLGWTPTSTNPNEHLRRADRAWRHQPGSAAHNATWEDWERWHEAQSGATNHDRKPLYMSNRMFAAIVLAMCTVGAMVQKSRAESIGVEYVEWKAKRHAEIGMELSKRGMEMAGMGRDERVDAFVRERENANYAYAPTKYDSIPNR